MIRPSALLLSLCFMTAAPIALAQTTDPVAATELFRQGREAMATKDYKTAAQKLAESARLDGKVGTFINLAECEEQLGQIAAARQHLQRAIDLAGAQGDDRLDLAKTRFTALDKRVPRLTVTFTAKVEGARVRRDDAELGPGSLGSALPVEPGEHVVTVSAPGHEDKVFKVTLAEAAQQTLAVDVGPEGAATPANGEKAPPTTGGGSSTKTIGYIVGGAGIVALGIGTIFALVAINKNSKSKESCGDDNFCDQPGFDARTEARSAGNIATVGFVVGGAALAAGAVLVLISPSVKKPASARLVPLVSPRSAGFTFEGAF
jgi:Tfp pilus assembly protein PilF